MKKFTYFWRSGKSEVLEGADEVDALNKAGYGHGALKALDFWGRGDIRDEYKWDAMKHDWVKNQ